VVVWAAESVLTFMATAISELTLPTLLRRGWGFLVHQLAIRDFQIKKYPGMVKGRRKRAEGRRAEDFSLLTKDGQLANCNSLTWRVKNPLRQVLLC